MKFANDPDNLLFRKTTANFANNSNFKSEAVQDLRLQTADRDVSRAG